MAACRKPAHAQSRVLSHARLSLPERVHACALSQNRTRGLLAAHRSALHPRFAHWPGAAAASCICCRTQVLPLGPRLREFHVAPERRSAFGAQHIRARREHGGVAQIYAFCRSCRCCRPRRRRGAAKPSGLRAGSSEAEQRELEVRASARVCACVRACVCARARACVRACVPQLRAVYARRPFVTRQRRPAWRRRKREESLIWQRRMCGATETSF
eukprot:6188151-Pleurochrysis_carterae.AAC.2